MNCTISRVKVGSELAMEFTVVMLALFWLMKMMEPEVVVVVVVVVTVVVEAEKRYW